MVESEAGNHKSEGLPSQLELGEQTQTDKPKQGRGRPKGRKNNKTLEREALIAQGIITAPKPKKKGRPKGRKDDWTLMKEAREAAGEEMTQEEMSQRPRRGRPKGRKNNKTLAKEAQGSQENESGRESEVPGP